MSVALKTNPGRPQDVELADVLAAVLGGGGLPQHLYRGHPPIHPSSRRRADELALFVLGVL